MRLLDYRGALAAALALTLLAAPHAARAEDSPIYRYEAPIAVERNAPFIELPLPAEAYARSRRSYDDDAFIADLRIVDARGERVPFAWLPRRGAETTQRETARDATLYALPARPAADGSWRAPIDVVVEGDRVQVRRLGSTTAGGSTSAASNARSGGWVVDLGSRRSGDPVPEQLRLAWSGPAEFTAAFDLATSDDLRTWRAAGSGQVLALRQGGDASAAQLAQPDIALPAGSGRFVRLVWADAPTAPQIIGAKSISVQRDSVARDVSTELSLMPKPASAPDAAAPRAVDFDLGGPLPLIDLELQWASGTHVAPVRVMTRVRSDEPWRDAGAAVFYRLDRQGTVSTSPRWAWRGTARYVRVVPDERAAALDANEVRLRVHAELAHLVFASQGAAPYRLQVGSGAAAGEGTAGNRRIPATDPATATATALPIGALVPALDEERAKFGAAAVGAWAEVAEAARRDDATQRAAALRPWLLWAVLAGGVAVLAFMVWRLKSPAAPRSA